MKKLILAMLFLIGSTVSGWAGMRTVVIEYKEGDTVMEGYLAFDDRFSGQRPGVLVVHEWMGLNDYAKMRADMLARLGYVAFAADIYGKGVRPQTVAEASAESTKYKNDRPLLRKRAAAALAVLAAQHDVDSKRLAAIGYCFGGTTVLELARSGADLNGVVSFHGGLVSPTPQDAKNIKAKILVLHGAKDPFVLPAEVAAFEQEMRDAKVDYRLIKYPGAVHGFTNPANVGEIPGALFNPSEDKKSWQEMKTFFKRIF